MNETISTIFKWDAMEAHHHERSNDWYWAVGVLTVVGVGLSIYFQNYFFAFFLLLAGVLVVYYALQTPEHIDIHVSDAGININNRLYPYKNIEAFWIAEHEDMDMHLLISTTQDYIPLYSIPIGNHIDVYDLRDYLLIFVEEREMVEPLIQRISYRLKF